jgi:hypothetical protein
MKKPKLKLEAFERDDKNILPLKFLSKIIGGDTDSSSSSGSSTPQYTISVQSNVEIETSKEN